MMILFLLPNLSHMDKFKKKPLKKGAFLLCLFEFVILVVKTNSSANKFLISKTNQNKIVLQIFYLKQYIKLTLILLSEQIHVFLLSQ